MPLFLCWVHIVLHSQSQVTSQKGRFTNETEQILFNELSNMTYFDSAVEIVFLCAVKI